MLFRKYLSSVVTVENPLEGIYTVEFALERGKFRYKSGQFLHLAVDEGYDGVGQWPDSRCFSMQSSPEEGTIRITYAVKGQFTTAMCNSLKPGARVWLKLPYGDLFTQAHSKVNTVFLAGGTGVTPFLSLFGHSDFELYEDPRIYLGFKSRAFNIYESELKNIKNQSTLIGYYYGDEEGDIDINSVFAENGSQRDYFISGPPMMITSFKEKLMLHGVNPENIKTDDWE
jgi:ferredoxin-NADP reductase